MLFIFEMKMFCRHWWGAVGEKRKRQRNRNQANHVKSNGDVQSAALVKLNKQKDTWALLVPTDRPEKKDKRPQVKMGKHTIYYKTQGKRALTSSRDVYISSKGLLSSTPLCTDCPTDAPRSFLLSQRLRMSFSKVRSLWSPPHPQHCSKVNTDNANSEIVGRKASM